MLASPDKKTGIELKSLNLVLFDGECGLCNQSVKFIMKNEKQNADWYFVPQSSPKGQSLLSELLESTPEDTIYIFKNEHLYKRSLAVFEIAKTLRFPYSLIQFGRFLPLFLTDKLYDILARNRSRIIANSCSMKHEMDKNRFIFD